MEAAIFYGKDGLKRGLADQIGSFRYALQGLADRIQEPAEGMSSRTAPVRVEARKIKTAAEIFARRKKESRISYEEIYRRENHVGG